MTKLHAADRTYGVPGPLVDLDLNFIQSVTSLRKKLKKNSPPHIWLWHHRKSSLMGVYLRLYYIIKDLVGFPILYVLLVFRLHYKYVDLFMQNILRKYN